MSQVIVGANPTQKQIYIEPQMANRHGLIAGATGTGKTVTLQVLAEQFSKMGVPVFTADVKGDLSGLAKAGTDHPKIQERIQKIKLNEFSFEPMPCLFWDLYGKNGHPIRTTVQDMGPLLLARLLDLSETQEDVLHVLFKYAEDKKLPLLDIKDIKAVLAELSENASALRAEYGNVAKSTVGAITRKLIVLEEAGGENFFSEPALDIAHIMQTDFSGRGVISILDATKLMIDRRLYSNFLLWLLSELFENLDEVGNPDKPRLVFFFDEAHLLFKDAPKVLLEKIETVVRLIRSKGVGVFFVTQNPLDVPEEVLGQLGNRVQHALRAFTAKDKKAVKMAAQTFRENPGINAEQLITELGTGESLVSTLDLKGAPSPVDQVLNSPPRTRMGPLTDEERAEVIAKSPIKSIYEKAIDRESAYELLKERQKKKAELDNQEERQILKKEPKRRRSNRQSVWEAFFKSIVRAIGSKLGRTIIQSLFKK